jgi:hypothetical protein
MFTLLYVKLEAEEVRSMKLFIIEKVQKVEKLLFQPFPCGPAKGVHDIKCYIPVFRGTNRLSFDLHLCSFSGHLRKYCGFLCVTASAIKQPHCF